MSESWDIDGRGLDSPSLAGRPVPRLGAIHRPAPEGVPRLAAVVPDMQMRPVPSIDHYGWLDLTGEDGLPDPLGNLAAGCCVPAAAFRSLQIKRSFGWHDKWKPTAAQVLAAYAAWSDYPAQDIGTDTARACAAWQREGLVIQTGTPTRSPVQDVPVWVSLDPQDPDELRLAIQWFGAVELTFRVPVTAQDAEAWYEPPPGTAEWGLHRVACGAYDPDGLNVISWGKLYRVSPAFEAARLVAADAMISRIWLQQEKSVHKNTWEDLLFKRRWLVDHQSAAESPA